MPKTYSALLLGTAAGNRKPMRVKQDGRAVHMHIIGTSGRGKSKLLEHMLRNDLQYENGFILLDPHGDVYQNTLEFASYYDLSDQVILIDPADTAYSVGLNYLEYDERISTPAAHADMVKKAISKAFGGENLTERPRLDRWLKVTLQTLIAAKLPISAYHNLLSTTDSTLRNSLSESLDPEQNSYIIREWQSFAEYKADEQKNILDSVENRLRIFIDDPTLERMFCQPKTTIDFRAAMDEGKAILVNLRQTAALSEQKRTLLGILLIDKIMQTAQLRALDTPETDRRRMYLYIDEFELFLTEDIARGLKEMRKFGLSFVLAHQNIDEIRVTNRKIYSSLGNAKLKVSFALAREDAEIMAKELFDLSQDEIKDELLQTKLYPRESIRVVEGESSGQGSANMQAHGRSVSSGEGTSDMSGTSASMSLGSTGSIGPDGMPGDPMGFSLNMNEGSNQMSGFSSFSGTSESYTEAQSDSEFTSRSQSFVPFYEYDQVEEVTGRSFYSVDEKLERFISWLKEQPVRRALFKILGYGKAPLPITIPEVKLLREDPELLAEFKKQVYAQHATPVQQLQLLQIEHTAPTEPPIELSDDDILNTDDFAQ